MLTGGSVIEDASPSGRAGTAAVYASANVANSPCKPEAASAGCQHGRSASSQATGWPKRCAKASVRLACCLYTASARSTRPPKLTNTPPMPACRAASAKRQASYRLPGPSALSALAGRIAPVSSTGRVGGSTSDRKNAVSSSVSVPCVMTMASGALSPFSHARSRPASCSQCAPLICSLGIEKTCSVASRPSGTSVDSPGTESRICPMGSAPAW